MTKHIIRSAVILVAAAFLITPPAARGAEPYIIAEGHTPPVMDYISYCDGTYHGIHYCNFADTFSVVNDQVAKALAWYDLGCHAFDQSNMNLAYALADADTYEVIASTTESVNVVCNQEYPVAHNQAYVLPIQPTTLRAGRHYFVLLQSLGNERSRAYWGVDAGYGSSFQVLGASENPVPVPTSTPAAKRPVVIVPGMLGASLVRPGGGEVWPNAQAMVTSAADEQLNELTLDRNGRQISGKEVLPGSVLEDISISVLGAHINHSIYGDLIKEFVESGYVLGNDLFLAPYDWRMDVSEEVSRLSAVVDSARMSSIDGKVVIIAHSMGGLLVKKYLSDPAQAAGIEKAILVGVPQLGAPAMFKVLRYGSDLGFSVPVINKSFLSPSKVKDIAQNMPGAYELLPSRRYVALNGSYVNDMRGKNAALLSYDATKALLSNSFLAARADAFHKDLDVKPVSGTSVYQVVGCDHLATLGEIRLYDGEKVDIGVTNGDGTVPIVSALAGAAGDTTSYFVSSRLTGIDHMGLVRDPRATGLIRKIAEGAIPAPSPAISTSTSVCFPENRARSFKFGTHSPVALHVYDSTGRHTGPTAAGIIETGIPGSTYDELAGNSFVFVPAGETYRIVANGLAKGVFTLDAEVLAGADSVTRTEYANVPLAGTSTVATMQFSETDMQPTLALDKNGDGATDAMITPATYPFRGFLRPVLNDGSGIYRIGSVVPLRFRLQSPDGTFISNAKATFSLTKISDVVTGTRRVVKNLKKRARFGSGNDFVYLSKTKEYAFDLRTSGLTRGTWELELVLDDGQAYVITLSFK